MTSALETHGLTIGYKRGQKPLLSGLNLSVGPGDLVSILGANGAGKSTLLRTLARSQPPLAGSVSIRGTDTARMSPYDLARHIGVLLTERVSVAAMPAIRLVELGRYPYTGWSGLLNDDDRQIVAAAIEAVGATHLAQRDLNELSDGERQRIMIARALAQRPAVLLLDEPAAFLDVSARVEMIAMLRRLARDQGVAVILSSHDLDLALRLSDTIWLLDGQGALHTGAPEDLLSSGRIDAAFSNESIAFSPADRTFRIRSKLHGTAHVAGPADAIDLVMPLLQREGFGQAISPGEADFALIFTNTGWTLGEHAGKTYAELARLLRKHKPVPMQ